jgi:hypothetical protein
MFAKRVEDPQLISSLLKVQTPLIFSAEHMLLASCPSVSHKVQGLRRSVAICSIDTWAYVTCRGLARCARGNALLAETYNHENSSQALVLLCRRAWSSGRCARR